MQLLRGLRLNCFLAALVPCLLACMGLAYQQHLHQQKLLNSYARAASFELQTYANLFANEAQRKNNLEYIAHAQSHWNLIATVQLEKKADDLFLVIQNLYGKGHSLEIDNPHPDLIKSQIETQHWQIGPLKMAVACPLRNGDLDLGVLYGEMTIQDADNHLAFLTLLSSALFCGILLSWYLSKRIYQPIEYLCQETDAIVHGSTKAPGVRQSAETAHVASSINDLLSLYQAQNKSFANLDSSLDAESKSDSKDE